MGKGIPEKQTSRAIRTPDQRLRVFISSTLKELAAERDAAQKAISRLRLTPILFESGARPHPARDLYRSYLAQSQIFIGIYWQQYGWVAPDMEISGLEDEYQLSEGMPRLIYIKNPAPEREQKLKELLAQIKAQDTVSYKYFSDADELKRLIESDLALLITESFVYSPSRDMAGNIPAEKPLPIYLPQKLSRFIGRAVQVEEVSRLVQQTDNHLVTLTGPGGVGKTRLALAVAQRLSTQFSDGVFFIDLAPVTDPHLVISTIAGMVGVRQAPNIPLIETLKDFLREKKILFVLDNVEQVISAGPYITDLLSGARGTRALVTSREVLQVQGEREFPVPPMKIPAHDDRTLEAIRKSETVQLFLDRADGKVELTQDNVKTIAEICRKLDGLPLAIELAAARTRLLSPQALLSRLEERFKALGNGLKDSPARQQTLRSTIDWSYQLLGPQEQKVFARLSVFQGNWGLGAAEVVCDLEEDLDILDIVGSLLNKSLIFRREDLGEEPRFGMLETIREYAQERLNEQGEQTLLWERHAQYYLDFMNREKTVVVTVNTPEWLSQLDANVDNFRIAFERCLAMPAWFTTGAQMAHDLLNYWYLRGLFSEALSWYQRLSEHSAKEPSLEYAYLLSGAGIVTCWIGDLPEANRLLGEAITMLRRYDDYLELGEALMFRGISAVNEGNGEAARPFLEESLQWFSAVDNHYYKAISLMHLGNVELAHLDLDAASRWLEESERLARETGGIWVLASVLNNFGEIARCRQDYAEAEKFYRASGDIFSMMNARGDVARNLHSKAYIALHMGHPEQALRLFKESLLMFQAVGIQRGIAECLVGIAAVCAVQNQPVFGAKLSGFAQSYMENMGLDWWPADRLELEAALNILKNSIGKAAVEQAQDEGLFLSLEEAVDFVHQIEAQPQ